jgi:Domain of unknown function (DUF4166)
MTQEDPLFGSANSRVEQWFGDQFSKLHPAIQALHLQGGRLSGDIHLSVGNGLTGIIGRRFARRMGFTRLGLLPFSVDIFHDDNGLHWNRRIDNAIEIQSLFVPVGRVPHGYWIEETGIMKLALDVDIHDGGWHWRCLKAYAFGIRIPLF